MASIQSISLWLINAPEHSGRIAQILLKHKAATAVRIYLKALWYQVVAIIVLDNTGLDVGNDAGREDPAPVDIPGLGG
jgi:hypothetical protein